MIKYAAESSGSVRTCVTLYHAIGVVRVCELRWSDIYPMHLEKCRMCDSTVVYTKEIIN